MSESRKLPAAEPRVETGVVEFGEDWPGLFIRGKHAFWYRQNLQWALCEFYERLSTEAEAAGAPISGIDEMRLASLRELLSLLAATRVKPKGPVQ